MAGANLDRVIEVPPDFSERLGQVRTHTGELPLDAVNGGTAWVGARGLRPFWIA